MKNSLALILAAALASSAGAQGFRASGRAPSAAPAPSAPAAALAPLSAGLAQPVLAAVDPRGTVESALSASREIDRVVAGEPAGEAPAPVAAGESSASLPSLSAHNKETEDGRPSAPVPAPAAERGFPDGVKAGLAVGAGLVAAAALGYGAAELFGSVIADWERALRLLPSEYLGSSIIFAAAARKAAEKKPRAANDEHKDPLWKRAARGAALAVLVAAVYGGVAWAIMRAPAPAAPEVPEGMTVPVVRDIGELFGPR